MDTRKLFLMFWLLTLFSSTAYGGDLMVGDPYLHPKDPSSHKSMTATVVKIVSGMVFFKTEEGTIRNFGMKEIGKEEVPSLQLGDEISLILDRGNSILDVTEAGGKGGFIGNEVTGTVLSFDGLEKMITLKTEEGKVQGFLLKDAVATKLSGIKKGRTVILAIDGQDRVMDAYRPE